MVKNVLPQGVVDDALNTDLSPIPDVTSSPPRGNRAVDSSRVVPDVFKVPSSTTSRHKSSQGSKSSTEQQTKASSSATKTEYSKDASSVQSD